MQPEKEEDYNLIGLQNLLGGAATAQLILIGNLTDSLISFSMPS